MIMVLSNQPAGFVPDTVTNALATLRSLYLRDYRLGVMPFHVKPRTAGVVPVISPVTSKPDVVHLAV